MRTEECVMLDARLPEILAAAVARHVKSVNVLHILLLLKQFVTNSQAHVEYSAVSQSGNQIPTRGILLC